jgi:hypothetical protein
LVRFLISWENFRRALKTHVKVRGCSEPAVRFVGILLVSGSKRSWRISAVPNEGIEQMARKNDGERQAEHDGSHYDQLQFLQLNDGLPVTVRFARMVGDVLTMGSAKGEERQPFKF